MRDNRSPVTSNCLAFLPRGDSQPTGRSKPSHYVLQNLPCSPVQRTVPGKPVVWTGLKDHVAWLVELHALVGPPEGS